jgi:hypothetical protein
MAAGREERWICDRLRGLAIENAPQPDAAALLQVARRNRVHVLLSQRLASTDGADPLRHLLAPFLRRAQIEEAIVDTELARVIDACAAAGVRPLIFKGAALAYSIYPFPWQRPRDDLDLFVSERDARALRPVLRALGYESPPQIESDLVTRQFQVIRHLAGGVRLTVDVHWRFFNVNLLDDALSYGEAAQRSVLLPRLGEHARGLDYADGLFVACLHRVVHHDDADDLIWLYDVHLLSEALSESQWEQLVRLARRSRTCTIVRASLAAAAERFDTRLPATIDRDLAVEESEPSAAYLGGGLRQIDLEWMNLQHESSWTRRASLVGQHLFPPAAYMRRRYNVPHVALLPLFYLFRIVAGAPGWWKRNP